MARGPIVIVKTDLSSARLVAPGASREWTAPPLPDDRPPTVREARARAAGAASWLARDADAKRRIDAIYTDIDEALCVWMRSPSAARPVVASQLRTMAQDWGDGAAVLAVEPLREDAGPAPQRLPFLRARSVPPEDPIESATDPEPRAEAPGFAVIALPDAMTRLLAGAADAAGARIGAVGTVWHLMAEADRTGPDTDVRGVVMLDPDAGRFVWAWGDRTGLVAAGAARTHPDHAADAIRRLALDWLTWAAQLGRCPGRLIVVGPGAAPWAESFAGVWQRVPTRAVESPDPIRALAELRPADPAPVGRSGRRSLARITHRPTRETRTRYQIAGAALALLLVATSSVAFRLWQKSGEWRAARASIRQEMIAAVREAWPKQSTTQQMTSPRRVAETLLEQEIRETKPFEAPPRPRPILDEALRIATILAAKNPGPSEEPGAEPVVRLTQIVLEQERANTLQFSVPDRQLATELMVALNTDAKLMRWERAAQSPNPNAPNLLGTWTKETD